MRAVDSTDLAFIADTYSDPDWSVDDIAEKLGLSDATVRKYGRQLGKKRTGPRQQKTPSKDWESLWYARLSGMNYESAAEAASMEVATAKKAVKRMLNMTEAERIITWNLYRQKHGMPLFAKC